MCILCYGVRSSKNAAPFLWNSLPPALKTSSSSGQYVLQEMPNSPNPKGPLALPLSPPMSPRRYDYAMHGYTAAPYNWPPSSSSSSSSSSSWLPKWRRNGHIRYPSYGGTQKERKKINTITESASKELSLDFFLGENCA